MSSEGGFAPRFRSLKGSAHLALQSVVARLTARSSLPPPSSVARAKPAREGRLLRHVPGVAAAAVLLVGCTTRPVVLDGTLARGNIATRVGRPGVVVAAPHGTSDIGTGEMAAEIARRTGFGLVVATGFNVEADSRVGPSRRYQVNRPVEGVPGRPVSEDTGTEVARSVYEAYERGVREAAQGPLRFYTEIHGNNRREAGDRIEIATVGVDAEQAAKLRALLELVRDAHLRARPGATRLDVRVEPADALVYSASGAKRAGILRLPQRALHIELPRVARQDGRELYTLILSDFLLQAIALPLPIAR